MSKHESRNRYRVEASRKGTTIMFTGEVFDGTEWVAVNTKYNENSNRFSQKGLSDEVEAELMDVSQEVV